MNHRVGVGTCETKGGDIDGRDIWEALVRMGKGVD